MTADAPQSYWLIDPPVTPFSPLREQLAWRDECRAMLDKYPNHPQWLDELRNVEATIAEHQDQA
jgi:hypothetical protein